MIITAKINVTKITKSKLFKGEKGTYLDLVIYVNDKNDPRVKFGKNVSILESQKQEERDEGLDKNYIGSGSTVDNTKQDDEIKGESFEANDLPF